MNLKNIVWTKNDYNEFIIYLKSISEMEYKKFNEKIIFTKYEILGIRLTKLRNMAKEISKSNYKSFLMLCQTNYYEEVMLYLLVVAKIKNVEELMAYFSNAVSLIDNWALCDTFCNSLKIVFKNKIYFLEIIDKLIKSNETFKIRVGLIILLNYYAEEEYLSIILEYLDNIVSDEYYVNMAEAWLGCEIFIKYRNVGLKYLQNNKLNKFTLNKCISKIKDSYRIDEQTKKTIDKYKQ